MHSPSTGKLPPRSSAREPATFAALDLGTNNCRLLIATLAEDAAAGGALGLPSIRVCDSFSRVVRLGEGVATTGNLSDAAMERTLTALKACQKKLSRYSLAHGRFVATEACRRAKNGAAFLERVRAETGIDIEIIATEEEARLAFLGCASLVKAGTEQAIVFDIGGGSTELMWVDVGLHAQKLNPIVDWYSVPFGVMNLADKYGGSDFSDLAFSDMVGLMTEHLSAFDARAGVARHVESDRVQMLSTSGTVTTLAAIHMGLPRYDRAQVDGVTLSIPALSETIRSLLAMRPSERFNHPCIGPDRADFIISGCAIFEAIARLWPAGTITIADRGVREGIILSLREDA